MLKAFPPSAALAYGPIHRGCSPADLAAHAMLWPRGGHVPQQTKAGRATKPPTSIATQWPACRRRDGSSHDMGCRHNQRSAERAATRAGHTKHSCFEVLCVCAPAPLAVSISPPRRRPQGYGSGRSFDTAASLSPSRSGLMMPRGNMIVRLSIRCSSITQNHTRAW